MSITKGHLYQKRKENSFMKRIIFLFFILHASFFTAFTVGASGIYQYSVALTGYVSTETGKAPTAYLWIPEGCQQVKAVMLAQQNMTEEMLYKNETFREKMKALDLALVWVAPWFSQNWDPTTGCQQTFEEMMVGLAGQSGHKEPELSWFDNLKTTWEETRVLDGSPGSHIVVARRSGEDWYVAAMTNNEARTITIPTDFLKDGQRYTVTIYNDDPTVKTSTKVSVKTVTIKAGKAIRLTLQPSGGAALHLVKTLISKP